MNEWSPPAPCFPRGFSCRRPRLRSARDFFATQLHNDHTRKAYLNATRRLAAWCMTHGLQLADVEAFHVAAFLKDLQHKDHQPKPFTAPTVKQHLAALRMLFDWLVVGRVIDVNPAHVVRGPKHVVKKGKTPVLTATEARELLDSIPVVRNMARKGQPESLKPLLLGLRDRALIAVMVYSFARVNAAIRMKVRDYFVQGRRGWVRLHEKGANEHELPCHHNLEKYLDEYVAAAGIAGDPEGPLSAQRTARPERSPAIPCGTRTLTA
jgi:site-specific recombinase XerD